MPTFAELMTKNPEYEREVATWREITLFYEGGTKLLDAIRHPERHHIAQGDEILIERTNEGSLYEERKRRAYVLGNTGHLINYFASCTMLDPPAVKEKGEEVTDGPSVTPETGAPGDAAEAGPESPGGESTGGSQEASGHENGSGHEEEGEGGDAGLPEGEVQGRSWFDEFVEDVDRRGTDLAEFFRQRLIEALTVRCSYVFVDFPEKPEQGAVVKAEAEGRTPSLADEETDGLTEGYFLPIQRDQILDWDRDMAGAMTWANVLTITNPRASFEDKRNKRVYEWRVMTPGHVALYRLEWDTEGGKNTPPDDTPVKDLTEINLRFDDLPLHELNVPDGLWVGSKIHPAERELLNKRNAKSWAEYNTAYAMIVAAVNDPESIHATDGGIIAIKPDESLTWLELAGASLSALESAIKEIIEEVHRIANQLALAAPIGAMAGPASGEAKRRDNAPGVIVCKTLAMILRDSILACMDLVKDGRGEEATTDLEVTGLRRFDDDSSILELIASGTLDKLKSPTLQKEIAKRGADEVLPDLEPSIAARIAAELEKSAGQQQASRDRMAKLMAEQPEAFAPVAPIANGGPPRPGMPG